MIPLHCFYPGQALVCAAERFGDTLCLGSLPAGGPRSPTHPQHVATHVLPQQGAQMRPPPPGRRGKLSRALPSPTEGALGEGSRAAGFLIAGPGQAHFLPWSQNVFQMCLLRWPRPLPSLQSSLGEPCPAAQPAAVSWASGLSARLLGSCHPVNAGSPENIFRFWEDGL